MSASSDTLGHSSLTPIPVSITQAVTHTLSNTSHPLLLPPVDWCCYGNSGTQLAGTACFREKWLMAGYTTSCVCACALCSALLVLRKLIPKLKYPNVFCANSHSLNLLTLLFGKCTNFVDVLMTHLLSTDGVSECECPCVWTLFHTNLV